VGVIDEEDVEAPVKARPADPSAIKDDEADLYPTGSVTTAALMREETPFERVARAVLSGGKKKERKRSQRRVEAVVLFRD